MATWVIIIGKGVKMLDKPTKSNQVSLIPTFMIAGVAYIGMGVVLALSLMTE